MFNIGFAEVIVILLVAFLVVGPDDLPKVARSLARFVKMMRQMFQDFKEETGLEETLEELKEAQTDIESTLREADPSQELREAKKTLDQALRESRQQAKQGLNPPNNKEESK